MSGCVPGAARHRNLIARSRTLDVLQIIFTRSNSTSRKAAIHRCVKVKSGKIVPLLKIFLNIAASDCFVSLTPIFTIFSIQVQNDIVHMSHHFGCHGNLFGMNVCVTIVTKLLLH